VLGQGRAKHAERQFYGRSNGFRGTHHYIVCEGGKASSEKTRYIAVLLQVMSDIGARLRKHALEDIAPNQQAYLLEAVWHVESEGTFTVPN
jgi:hypothetical protein